MPSIVLHALDPAFWRQSQEGEVDFQQTIQGSLRNTEVTDLPLSSVVTKQKGLWMRLSGAQAEEHSRKADEVMEHGSACLKQELSFTPFVAAAEVMVPLLSSKRSKPFN